MEKLVFTSKSTGKSKSLVVKGEEDFVEILENLSIEKVGIKHKEEVLELYTRYYDEGLTE